jgi:hypothetical protein
MTAFKSSGVVNVPTLICSFTTVMALAVCAAWANGDPNALSVVGLKVGVGGRIGAGAQHPKEEPNPPGKRT